MLPSITLGHISCSGSSDSSSERASYVFRGCGCRYHQCGPSTAMPIAQSSFSKVVNEITPKLHKTSILRRYRPGTILIDKCVTVFIFWVDFDNFDDLRDHARPPLGGVSAPTPHHTTLHQTSGNKREPKNRKQKSFFLSYGEWGTPAKANQIDWRGNFMPAKFQVYKNPGSLFSGGRGKKYVLPPRVLSLT